MTLFKPPVPPVQKRRPFFLRMLLGMQRSYLANFIEKSYEMKMGHIWLPGRDIYMPNQPDLVRRILVTEADHYPKSDMVSKMLRMLLGDGIFVSNGEKWKKQRRMIDPAFVLAKLQRVFPLMWQAVETMLVRLEKYDDGAIVEIDEVMTHVTADVIFRTIFSLEIGQQRAELLFDAFTRFQETAFVYGFLDSTKIPNIFAFRHRRKAAKAAQDIRQLIEPIIAERYQRYQRGEELIEDDILSSLVTAKDPQTGAVFSFEELVDQTAFLFLAGHETSASALSWTLYLTAMSSATQERMYQEAHSVLGERDPTFRDMKKLTFIRDVFREALRLYPPVGFLPREATRCETMRDKQIAPHDIMLISPWLMQRHRQLWEQPDHFDPNRFARKECAHAVRSAYIPFSTGPRICTGAGFALQEAVLLIATLVRKYRFDPVDGHVPRPVGRLTIRSENGIPLHMTRRGGIKDS